MAREMLGKADIFQRLVKQTYVFGCCDRDVDQLISEVAAWHGSGRDGHDKRATLGGVRVTKFCLASALICSRKDCGQGKGNTVGFA